MPKLHPGLSVEHGGITNTFGLFPPIICTSSGPPVVTTISSTATQVVIQVTFPGDTGPFVITVNLEPCPPPVN